MQGVARGGERVAGLDGLPEHVSGFEQLGVEKAGDEPGSSLGTLKPNDAASPENRDRALSLCWGMNLAVEV